MTELVGKVNEFLDRYPKLRDAIGTLALLGSYLGTASGGAIAFLANLGLVAANWQHITGLVSRVGAFLRLGTILGALGTVAKWVAGAVAGLAAVLGIPVWLAWLLVAAIMAAVAALIIFRDKVWAFIKGAGAAIWNFLKDLWATVKEIPGVIWEMVSQAVAAVWEFAQKLWERIRELPSRLWESIKNAIVAAYEWGKNIVLSIAKGIWDYITYPIRAFTNLLRQASRNASVQRPESGTAS
jgi:phage-related protein